MTLLNKVYNLISLLVLFWFQLTSVSFGKSIYVGAGKSLKTICEGVTAAAAGDTVYIEPGIYKEGKLIIQKPVSIIGLGFPVLDGEYKYEIITISGKNISLSGFKLINSGSSAMDDFGAIKCIDAREIQIYDNFIVNAHFAIHISNSEKILIKNNIIEGHPKNEQNTGNGIHIWKSNHVQLENNQLSGHRDGIYLEFVTESRITNNLCFKNIRYGLHFMFSHNDFYECNTFRNNGAGVAVMYSHHVHMERNTFENNWGPSSYGILLKDLSDSQIKYNIFKRNTVGIFIEGSNRMILENNSFEENGWALKVQASCNENTFQFNNFKGNSFDVATNGTMMLNKFNGNYWDKYDGYDRNNDHFGDVPYHPVNLYAMIVEQNPVTLILLRSILISFLDKAEKALPSITPELLLDEKPKMNPNKL